MSELQAATVLQPSGTSAPCTVLVTGGCGFLGQLLIRTILQRGSLAEGHVAEEGHTEEAGRVTGATHARNNVGQEADKKRHVAFSEVPVGKVVVLDAGGGMRISDERLEVHIGDITNAALVQSLISTEVKCIFHLAAVLSAGAEADYDLGMKVNVDGTRALLSACRVAGHSPKLVMASSVAVFGCPPGKEGTGVPSSELPAFSLSEDSLITPQSSYGTQKAVCELLLADASRRGFVDARAVRLPTIIVRPGKPAPAASSFCSSIIREPLNGQTAICPVSGNLPLWVQSPQVVVHNLLHALSLPPTVLSSTTITLPGLTTTPSEMIAALEAAGGDKSLIRMERDARIEAIVASWPGFIATPTAIQLGFQKDKSIQDIVDAFKRDHIACR